MNKVTIKKAALALLLTGTMMVCRNSSNAIGTIKFNKGDHVKSKVDLNIRLDDSIESKKIGLINKNEVVERVLSFDNGWDLIKYNDMYGYVSREYVSDIYTERVQEEHFMEVDIIKTTSKVNFRLEPNLEAKKIGSISKGELIDVIAKTENNWYLVSYNGTIGYVCGDYVTSLKNEVESLYPNYSITNLSLANVCYTTSGVNVRTGPSMDYQKIDSLSKYESALVLGEYNGWYLILNHDGVYGFVDKSFTKKIDNTFVIIDLSEQHLWLYDEDNVLLQTDIVTGKPGSSTNIGLFKIFSKQRDRYLTGRDYKAYVNYWMPFDGGIGLHDASWRKNFGGNIYLKNGSHGCVNMPSDKAEELYENVSVGTKVLVHK